LAERNSKYMRNEVELCRLTNNINIIKRQLAQKERQASELNAEMGAHPNAKKLTEAAKHRLKEKTANIEQLSEKLREKDVQIEQLEQLLAKRTGQVQELESEESEQNARHGIVRKLNQSTEIFPARKKRRGGRKTGHDFSHYTEPSNTDSSETSLLPDKEGGSAFEIGATRGHKKAARGAHAYDKDAHAPTRSKQQLFVDTQADHARQQQNVSIATNESLYTHALAKNDNGFYEYSAYS